MRAARAEASAWRACPARRWWRQGWTGRRGSRCWPAWCRCGRGEGRTAGAWELIGQLRAGPALPPSRAHSAVVPGRRLTALPSLCVPCLPRLPAGARLHPAALGAAAGLVDAQTRNGDVPLRPAARRHAPPLRRAEVRWNAGGQPCLLARRVVQERCLALQVLAVPWLLRLLPPLPASSPYLDLRCWLWCCREQYSDPVCVLDLVKRVERRPRESVLGQVRWAAGRAACRGLSVPHAGCMGPPAVL